MNSLRLGKTMKTFKVKYSVSIDREMTVQASTEGKAIAKVVETVNPDVIIDVEELETRKL